MATVTKPIALDESLNTTELAPRNVADVLAEELAKISGAISHIALPTTYDELSDLEDVNISSPTNGQYLQYDSVTQKWKNVNGGGGGGVSTDWFTKVWENPNPLASFSAQTITLSSGVGDLCLIEYSTKNISGAETKSALVSKGSSALLDISIGANSTPTVRSRQIRYVDSTHLNVIDAYVNGGVDNTLCIPLRVWYIQKNGLAGDVSTLASNCMLSNGDSVEDRLNKMPFHTMSVTIAGTVISSYYAQIATGLDTTKYRAIGLSEGSGYDEKCNFSIRENGNYIIVKCISSSYTIPASVKPLTLIYVDKDLFV